MEEGLLVDALDMSSTLVGWVSSAAMMFGGIVPYIPQYRDIRRTENADGFSLYVCLALLIANTLRILFWFGHPFEWPLLIQSVVMNATMFVLVNLCVKVKAKMHLGKGKDRYFFAYSKSDIESAYATVSESESRSPEFRLINPHVFWDFDVRHFWAWTDFLSYIEFMFTFAAVVGLAMYLFLTSYWFVESVGFLAVFIEALLGAPQFYRNYESKSTEGMSKKMVLMWLCGDIFKTSYFLIRDSPVQFTCCGLLQVFIDIAIISQILIYQKRPSVKPKPSTYIS